jgi:hypothetical protein
MSKARTINDYYATVFLHRFHKDNRPRPVNASRSLFAFPKRQQKSCLATDGVPQ